MKKVYDVIVLGAGASGSYCAINLKNNLNVGIIDNNSQIAKKLLVTGNGRCNLTNGNIDSSFYNQNLDCYFEKYDLNNTLVFFNKLGLETYFDNENRCYPISNSAKSVVKVIENEFHKKYFDYLLDNIQKIEYNEKENVFEIVCDNNQYASHKLVVAMGKNFFDIERNFEVSQTKLCPSLVALKTSEKTKKLDGIRVSNVVVNAITNDAQAVEKGEVLFKENGLSGICVFNLSSIFARNKKFEGKIVIDILPNYSQEQLIKVIKSHTNIFEKASDVLEGVVVNKLALELLSRLNIDEERLCCTLTDDEIKGIAFLIKNMTFNVVGCYENNQVYSGGVCLDCLTDSLEHKNIKGIYFCGEVCDVDAICGGYNLQWAWTSAKLVADDINNNQ